MRFSYLVSMAVVVWGILALSWVQCVSSTPSKPFSPQNISSLLMSSHYPSVLKTFRYLRLQQKTSGLEVSTSFFHGIQGSQVYITDFSLFELHTQNRMAPIPSLLSEAGKNSDRILLTFHTGQGTEFFVVDRLQPVNPPPPDANYVADSSYHFPYIAWNSLRNRDVLESCEVDGRNRKYLHAIDIRYLHFQSTLVAVFSQTQVPPHAFHDGKPSTFISPLNYFEPVDAFFAHNPVTWITIPPEDAYFTSFRPASTIPVLYPLPTGSPLTNFLFPESQDETHWAPFIYNMHFFRVGEGIIGYSIRDQQDSYLAKFRADVHRKYPPLNLLASPGFTSGGNGHPPSAELLVEDDVVMIVESIQPHRILYAPLSFLNMPGHDINRFNAHYKVAASSNHHNDSSSSSSSPQADATSRKPAVMGMHTVAMTYLRPKHSSLKEVLLQSSGATDHEHFVSHEAQKELWRLRSSSSSSSSSSLSSSGTNKPVRSDAGAAGNGNGNGNTAGRRYRVHHNGGGGGSARLNTRPSEELDFGFVWPYGKPRPGTPPTLVQHPALGDGFHYLSFFTSSVVHNVLEKKTNSSQFDVRYETLAGAGAEGNDEADAKAEDENDVGGKESDLNGANFPGDVYVTQYLGAYVFEPHPPFAITHVTRVPLTCEACYDARRFPASPNPHVDFGIQATSLLLRPKYAADQSPTATKDPPPSQPQDESSSQPTATTTVSLDGLLAYVGVSLNNDRGAGILVYDVDVLCARYMHPLEEETDAVVLIDTLSEVMSSVAVLDAHVANNINNNNNKHGNHQKMTTRRTTKDIADMAYVAVDKFMR